MVKYLVDWWNTLEMVESFSRLSERPSYNTRHDDIRCDMTHDTCLGMTWYSMCHAWHMMWLELMQWYMACAITHGMTHDMTHMSYDITHDMKFGWLVVFGLWDTNQHKWAKTGVGGNIYSTSERVFFSLEVCRRSQIPLFHNIGEKSSISNHSSYNVFSTFGPV